MSKITVRADDDLVAELDALEASKSQVVREALRAYLDDVNASSRRLTDGDVIEDADGGAIDTVDDGSLDALVSERVDELVSERVDAALASRGIGVRAPPQDVNVTVAVEGSVTDADASVSDDEPREVGSSGDVSSGDDAAGDAAAGDAASETAEDAAGNGADNAVADGAREDAVSVAESSSSSSCSQCGEELGGGHVYCPNCGEKASRRAFCECGDELRSDWAFCPGCGRRTPAADVLESG